MQEKDLIYLSYASNTCYSTVADKPPLGVVVDILAGTWSFEGKTYFINDMRRCDRGSRYGPIGVYDKSDIKNLGSMVSAWQEASSETVSIAFSD